MALFLDDNKTNDDGDGKENSKKMFISTNNNFARESRNFVHFFAIVAPLRQGGPTVKKARQVKKTATGIFAKATLTLHKWSSNARELELTETTDSEVGLTYAKEQLGEKPCSLLGLRWNKDDKIAVTFPTEIADPIKRGVLCKIAKIYDPIDLAAPVTLE